MPRLSHKAVLREVADRAAQKSLGFLTQPGRKAWAWDYPSRAPLSRSTSHACRDIGHGDNSPENGTCRTLARRQTSGRGRKWLVSWSLGRELRYAGNSQSVNQQTRSSGWLRRKAGRACRTKNFAAGQSKNRLPHLGEFADVFRKIGYQSRRKSHVKCGLSSWCDHETVPHNCKKPAALTSNEVR